jgi:hypothetical protein
MTSRFFRELSLDLRETTAHFLGRTHSMRKSVIGLIAIVAVAFTRLLLNLVVGVVVVAAVVAAAVAVGAVPRRAAAVPL